jgi:multidrug transporter EmrE-like cation transporter
MAEPVTAVQGAGLAAYLLLAACMLLNALANFVIKLAVRGQQFQLDLAHLGETLKHLATNPVLWGGVACFGVALVGYSIVLSRLNLSTAYPVMAGGGFLLVFVLSALYLREAVTMSQFGGALCIVLGMWLLLR